MHPVLFKVDVAGRLVTVHAYSFFLVPAIVVALIVAFVLAARAGLPKWRAAAVLVVALVAALLGARLLNVVLNREFYADDPGSLFEPAFSGLSLYGGLILACVLGLAMARALRVPAWSLLDATVPAVASGLVLARVGCFLNGCCFGTPTDLPWGVSFPKGSLAWAYDAAYGSLNLFGGSSPVHPTQLYEIGGVAASCTLAIWWSAAGRSGGATVAGTGKSRPPGTTFLVFAALLSLVRLGVHFLRAPVFATQAPAWFYPALYTLVAVGCVVLLLLRSRATASGLASIPRVREGIAG